MSKVIPVAGIDVHVEGDGAEAIVMVHGCWFGGRQSYRRHRQPFMPSCPMLFIYGSDKPLMFHAKAWTDDLLRTKGNEVVELDTGHWVMSAQPERFNQVVNDWLSVVPAR